MIEAARLAGWLRISGADLSIGIAVFASPSTNARLVPETGFDLRITGFIRIDEEDDLGVVSEIPEGFAAKRYGIGDPVPIPVCIHGTCEIVGADEAEDLPRLPRATPAERALLEDVRAVLDKARSGDHRIREENRLADDFSDEFADVLFGEPVRSRHWLDRLGTAGRALTFVPERRRGSHRETLARRFSEWLRRFRSKADPALVLRALEIAEERILSHAEFTTALADLLVDPDEARGWLLVASPGFEEMLRRRAPGGLYELERKHRDNIDYPFRMGFDTLNWFNHQFDRLAQSYDFEKLWRLSIAAFGRDDPPAGDIDRYRQLHRHEKETFEVNVRHSLSGIFRNGRRSDEWSTQASALLDQDHALRYLRRVFDGTVRPSFIPQYDVGGLDDGTRADLEMYVEGRDLAPGLTDSRSTRARRKAATARLPAGISDWLTMHGPLDASDAGDLLEASYGRNAGRYRSKLRRGRLEIQAHLRPTLVVKDKERIRSFRTAVAALVEESMPSPSEG